MAADNVHRVEFAIGLVERLLDFLAVVAAVWSAYWIDAAWREGSRAHYANDSVLATAAGFGLLMVLLLDKHGDYRPCLSLLAVKETERLLRVTIAGFLLALPILMVVANSIPHTAIALALVVTPLLLALEKWQAQAAIQLMRGCGAITRKAVILGTGTMGRSIFSTLVRSPKFGLDPVAFVAAEATVTETVIYEASYQRKRQASVLPGPLSHSLKQLRNSDAAPLAMGRNKVTCAPPDVRFDSRIMPPQSSIIFFAMVSPSSVPPGRRVKNGVKSFSICSGGNPGPWSSTSQRNRSVSPRSPRDNLTVTVPAGGECWIAFSTRFSRARTSRAGLTRTSPSPTTSSASVTPILAVRL